MKISTKSWHYRLNSFLINGQLKSQSLCNYFWRTLASVFVVTFILLTSLAIFVVGPIVAIVTWNVAYLAPTLGGVGMYLFLCILANLDEFDSRIAKKGLLPSYLKAKKDKVCPLIEFED